METKGYTFFWGGKFSNFYPVDIIIDDVKYSSTEQYFMAMKALYFEDKASYDKIMRTDVPRIAKALGRKVKNFNDEKWKAVSLDYMYKGNYAKYTQNEDLKTNLLATGATKLVEASPYDRIWGIGLSEEQACTIDESKWPGLNWLGITLCKVRETILAEENPENIFETLRGKFEWVSYGRNHDEPPRYTKLKDISDSHLLHIIPFVESRMSHYDINILETFKKEMAYRSKHNIYVPEYHECPYTSRNESQDKSFMEYIIRMWESIKST